MQKKWYSQLAVGRSGEEAKSTWTKWLLFLTPVAFLLFHLSDVPFLPTADYTDLMTSHLPNGLLIQQTIAQWHAIPLWSPAILSGYPFAADPLSGLYYLPGLLALLFPLPLGFNLLIAAHLIFAGLGLYLLLRAEGLSEPAALLGGLSFAALPKLYSHLGAGHLTLLYAIAWTPWLLLVEKRVHARFDAQPFVSVSKRLLPGLLLGIIALADVRWAAYAGILWLAYSLRLILSRRLELPVQPILPCLGRWVARVIANIALALLVAAAQLLPLIEYTRLSTRSALTPADNLALSLPVAGLLGLFYPTFPGTAEAVLYPGALVSFLALLALTVPVLRKRTEFWLAVAAVTLVWALGVNLPFLGLLARLPGMSLLRVPARALFVTGLALSAVAAYGVEWLITLHPTTPTVREAKLRGQWGELSLFALTAFIVLFGLLGALTFPKPLARILFGWGALFFLIAALLVGLARAGKIAPPWLVVLLLSSAMIDTLTINALLLEFRPTAEAMSAARPLIDAIQADAGNSGPYRVYSPSVSIPQQSAQAVGLEMADGVDPLQLAAYVDFMTGPNGATGAPSGGYSVTLPPHPGQNPTTDTRSLIPDAGKLGLLNVRYVTAAFPIHAAGLDLLVQVDGGFLYKNTLAMPRAWVQAADSPPGQQIRSAARVITQANRVIAEAEGPGLLVLSELAYPGWQARIDGSAATVETVGGLLRGVRIGPGVHSVVFDFHPVTVYIGLALAALAWLGFITVWIIERKARHD